MKGGEQGSHLVINSIKLDVQQEFWNLTGFYVLSCSDQGLEGSWLMEGAASVQGMALEITTCVNWESDVVCYKEGYKFFTKEVFWEKPAESVPTWCFLTLLSCTKQYTVDWARVLIWFERKQWWKGSFEQRLVSDQIHLILSVHVSYLNCHHHRQILVEQCFEIFSLGFSFWFCGCAAAGYSWLQVCSAVQLASQCEIAASLVPELAAGVQQSMDQ